MFPASILVMASLGFQVTSAYPISGQDRGVMNLGISTQGLMQKRQESPDFRGKQLMELQQKAVQDNVTDATSTTTKNNVTEFNPSDPLRRPQVFPDTMTGLIHAITKTALADWRVAASEWESVRDFSKDEMGGFEPSGKARRMRLQESQDTLVDGVYGEDGGFIALSTAEVAKADQVPVHEMVWQSFFDVAGSKASNLKAIYLTDVRSDDFKKALEINYSDTKQAKDRKVTWEIANNPRPKRFERLVGAEPIAGLMMMLMNHHQALGHKKVTKIITMPRGGLDKVDVAVILGDAK